MAENKTIQYKGSLVLPGEQDERELSISINPEDQAVQLQFVEPVGGENNWNGSNVKVVERLKYREAVFSTTGLPMDPVQMTWKFNTSNSDDSLAGVIIPKPNTMRVTGERGFILNKVS